MVRMPPIGLAFQKLNNLMPVIELPYDRNGSSRRHLSINKLEFINTERTRVGVGLSKVFRSFDCFQPPKIHEKLTHTFHYFPVLFDEKSAGMTRHAFCKALSAEGFAREGYTKPLYKLNILRHLSSISSRASLFNVGSCEPLKTVEEIESKLFSQLYVSKNDK